MQSDKEPEKVKKWNNKTNFKDIEESIRLEYQ